MVVKDATSGVFMVRCGKCRQNHQDSGQVRRCHGFGSTASAEADARQGSVAKESAGTSKKRSTSAPKARKKKRGKAANGPDRSQSGAMCGGLANAPPVEGGLNRIARRANPPEPYS